MTDSITYAFEKEFGWIGYLVEPQDVLFRKCVQNRNPQNRFFKCGIGPENKEIEIEIPIDNLDNASICLSESHRNELKNLGFSSQTKKEIIEIKTWDSIVKEGIYLAVLDVEGYENSILEHMMAHSDNLPKILVVETDWSDVEEMHKILDSKYMMIKKFKHDEVFFLK